MQNSITQKSAMRRIEHILGIGFDLISGIGALWIIFLMLLIVADILGRNFFNLPISGVAEIAARSVVAIVFLLLPAAAMKNSLIRADFLVRIFKNHAPIFVSLLDRLFSFAGAVMFTIIMFAAWPDTLEAWRSSEYFGVRGVWILPTFPFRLIVVLGSAATAIAFIIRTIIDLQNSKKNEDMING